MKKIKWIGHRRGMDRTGSPLPVSVEGVIEMHSIHALLTTYGMQTFSVNDGWDSILVFMWYD